MIESIKYPEIGSKVWYDLSPDVIDTILSERMMTYERRIAERGGKRPKREGYILERIATIDNLMIADRDAQRGKLHKNRYIRRHNQNMMAELRRLQLMILTLDFPESKYYVDMVVTDYGKVRSIVKRDFYPWRILEHAIINVIMPIIVKSLIGDSVACIEGRGIHHGVRRMKRFLRLHPECKWFWKSDYKKYYQSVPHWVMEQGLGKRIKDKNFFRLFRDTVLCYDSGEDIINQLCDEEARKKRNANWLLHKSTARSSRSLRGGSCDEGDCAGALLSPILR